MVKYKGTEKMIYYNKKKGSIGITVIMLVFCLLMSVAMSYHKTIQTETMVKKQGDYSERAMDAAFSGVNYAMSLIQADKRVFSGTKIYLVDKDNTTTDDKFKKMDWINLSQTFDNYFDDNRLNQKLPPYRFIVSCPQDSTLNYKVEDSKTYIFIKSIGEYIKYEENEDGSGEEEIGKYRAQIIAKCLINDNTRTIILKKYKKVSLQHIDSTGYPINVLTNSFFKLTNKEIENL